MNIRESTHSVSERHTARVEWKDAEMLRLLGRNTGSIRMFVNVILLLFIVLVVSFVFFYKYGIARPYPTNHNNFIYGLFQGFFAVPAFIISLFDDKVAVYQISNNSHWYDLGYLIGIGAIFSSGSSGVNSSSN